jgi:hypothetical protein
MVIGTKTEGETISVLAYQPRGIMLFLESHHFILSYVRTTY